MAWEVVETSSSSCVLVTNINFWHLLLVYSSRDSMVRENKITCKLLFPDLKVIFAAEKRKFREVDQVIP